MTFLKPNKYNVLACLIVFVYFVPVTGARALTMSNDTYRIERELDGIRSQQPKSSSDPEESEEEEDGISIEYVDSPISLTLAQTSINFGKLTPGEAVTRNLELGLQTSSGFSLFASEDHTLRSSGVDIPDTTCDQGNCNDLISADWSSPLTYGFGFHCYSETSGCVGFDTPLRFKQFANISRNPREARIASGKENTQLRITYKVNIPGSQKILPYQNNTMYILLPQL